MGFQLQPKASQTALQGKGQAEEPGVGASRHRLEPACQPLIQGRSSPLCRPSAWTMPLTHVALSPASGDLRENPQASGRQQASSRGRDGLHADSSGRQPCQPARSLQPNWDQLTASVCASVCQLQKEGSNSTCLSG